MKKYTPLDGLRWSRNSDSALNNMPQTDVLGRAGGWCGYEAVVGDLALAAGLLADALVTGLYAF